MNLEDFLNKQILVTLKDGTEVTGILLSINDTEDIANSIFYTSLVIRIEQGEYETIYINEIESIGEIK